MVLIPLRPTFYSSFKESFGDEYHMYQLIPLHSCDYLNKILIKTNVATDEGNSRMYQLIPLHSCDYLNEVSIKTNVATDEGNSQNEM